MWKKEAQPHFSPISPENWMCGWGKMGKKYMKREENKYLFLKIGGLLITSLNPQNLRNIIKKVAKINIIQILMSNLSV